ncbi:hypothetical protein [Labrys wisconsinensis]|uniref:Uncharacterized protein n=1 Tax=Labrys wisconsinensis TaxID=425677 RepID=A0ABU0J0J9_9HYPH|nr:hypothetical protein [Labrys wisconsinensis]MDQ0467071.1 hypothetical protein [Labrys wisconsinensis]
MHSPFLLSRLAGVPALNRAWRKAKATWKRSFQWPLHAVRKSRLHKYGLTSRSPLPVARLHLRDGCACRSLAVFVRPSWDAVRPLARMRAGAPVAQALTQTAAVIDLNAFPDFMAWRKQVSKLTQGKYHRSANKARRLGYVSRFIGAKSYERSLYELTGSKPRRSKGILVWASLIAPRPDLVDTRKPMVWPSCPRHWRLTWGAFHVDESGGERLAAFAKLMRSGDLVRVESFIGHGAALTDGVTKMLMFDIMEWLLERDHPCAEGVRYFIHGSIEEGGIGLFDWKRYLGFVPMLLDVADALQQLRLFD